MYEILDEKSWLVLSFACWLACLFACYLLFVRHIFICACDLVRCRVVFSSPSSFSIAGIFYVFTKLSIPSWALRDFVCLRSYAVKVFSKQKTKKKSCSHTIYYGFEHIFIFAYDFDFHSER